MRRRLAGPASPSPGKPANSTGYTPSQTIKQRYAKPTRRRQTDPGGLPRIGSMDKQQAISMEQGNVQDSSFHQFMTATREYLFGLMPAQPQLAAVPTTEQMVR